MHAENRVDFIQTKRKIFSVFRMHVGMDVEKWGIEPLTVNLVVPKKE